MLTSLLLFSVVNLAPLEPFFQNMDRSYFMSQVIGSKYRSMKPKEKKELEAAIETKLRSRMLEGDWTQQGEWVNTSRGQRTDFKNKKDEVVVIELVKNSSRTKFVDVRVDGTSVLVTVAGSLQKALQKKSLPTIISELKNPDHKQG